MTIAIDTVNWGWPQYTVVFTYALAIFLEGFLHGVPRSGEHNVVVRILAAAISVFILTSGGFFS